MTKDQLTRFQLDMLAAASRMKDPTGADIKRVLEERYGEKISGGRIYTGLSKIQDAGVFERKKLTGRSKAVVLTEKGERMLSERAEWLGGCEE